MGVNNCPADEGKSFEKPEPVAGEFKFLQDRVEKVGLIYNYYYVICSYNKISKILVLTFTSESAVATGMMMMMEISIFRLIYTVQKHLYLHQNEF